MSRFSFLLLVLLAGSLSMNAYLYFTTTINQVFPTQAPINIDQVRNTAKQPDKTAQKSLSKQQVTPSATASQANQLFDKQQFEQAVIIYEALLLNHEQVASHVKQRWIKQLTKQLKDGHYQTLDAAIEAILQAYPYDLEFLTLKADKLAATGNIDESIAIYHLLISNTFEIRQEEFFQARIRHLASEHIKGLETQLSWQAIITFVEQLLLQEADYPPYILALAQAQVHLGEFIVAEQILQPILAISFYRAQAQELIDQIQQTQLQKTAIKLQPFGEHYLVNGQINDSSDITLMIDTGASISVLTRAMFDQIENWTQPSYLGETLLNTAGGQVNAPIYQFERFQINDFFVDKFNFVVLDLDNMADYHGLLGMNFLKQFKFQIDQANNLLILSPD